MDPAESVVDKATRRVVMESPNVPYKVVEMDDLYGEGHRGAQTSRRIARGEIIQRESAMAYVTRKATETDVVEKVPDAAAATTEKKKTTKKTRKNKKKNRKNKGPAVTTPVAESEPVSQEGDDVPFFTKNKELCPSEIEASKGGLHIALTGILIRDREDVALFAITEGPFCLFGGTNAVRYTEPAEAYKLAKKYYFPEKDESVWNLASFTRIYAVVQMNAVASYIPLSNSIYGLGFFAGTSFFNHGCTPNAILVTTPGRCMVQAVCDIEEGEEITIAYKELPIDLLHENLVRFTHFDYGIECDTGCRCIFCRANDGSDQPDATPVDGGEDFSKSIEIDLAKMWNEETYKRLDNDEQFKTYVVTMLRMAGKEAGAAAAHMLRERYGHFLLYKMSPDDSRSYCPDLAFVLGELYVTYTIHVPGQYAADYTWWPRVYNMAIKASIFSLPRSMEQALLAQVYGALYSCRLRGDNDEAGKEQDTREFLINWASLRVLHAAIYGHTGHLVVACKTYPMIGDLVVTFQKNIANMERQINMDTIARAEREKKQEAEAAKKMAEAQAEEEAREKEMRDALERGEFPEREPCFEDEVSADDEFDVLDVVIDKEGRIKQVTKGGEKAAAVYAKGDGEAEEAQQKEK